MPGLAELAVMQAYSAGELSLRSQTLRKRTGLPLILQIASLLETQTSLLETRHYWRLKQSKFKQSKFELRVGGGAVRAARVRLGPWRICEIYPWRGA